MTVNGFVGTPMKVSPDGARAILSTNGQVVTIDANTGAVIGTVNLPGQLRDPVSFTPDSTRAIQNTYAGVVVIDTATGNQIGSTVATVGAGNVALSSDSRRVVFYAYDPNLGQELTHVVVIDTATGTQIGSAAAVSGTGDISKSSSPAVVRCFSAVTTIRRPPRRIRRSR